MIKQENLPEEWEIKLLSEVCDVRDGTHDSPKYIENGFPLITSKNVTNGYIDFSNVNLISKEDYDKINKRSFVDNGDILMPMIGTIGNPIIVKKEREFAIKNVALIKFTKTDISNIYVKHLLDSEYFKYYIKRTNRGVTQKFLALRDIRGFLMPIPPLKTQKKIVEILEKAEKLKEWRTEADELADEFLKSVFLEMFGDPVKNEKEWNLVNLSELGAWKSGGTPSRKNKEFFMGEIPWYTSGELNSMHISDSIEKITKEAIDNSNAKLIEPNSLLLGMYDTAALKSSITTIPSSCNQAIAYSKLEYGKSNIVYVYFAIQIGRKFFMSRQRGIRQKNLNLTMIKETEIPLPPIELQNQFAEIVKKVETLKTHQKQSKQEIDNLFNALMQKAFKGELTC